MEITRKLAEFLQNASLKNIPEKALNMAHEHILDCVGVTIAGSADLTGRIITKFVKEMGGEPKASVICGGFKTSVPQAAFANGTMAHALDFDDDYSDFTVVHPSAVVLPAALAVSEAYAASGEGLLEAYILGIEIEIAIGSISNMEDINRGWHGTSTLGTIGAAAACAKIMKLDTEQIRVAMGIAASSSCGLRQNFGTMTKPFHAGKAAESGVIAAMLAQRGFTANNEILESPFGFLNLFAKEGNWESRTDVVNQLGNPFKVFSPGIYIKQYPSCAGTHSSIDAILHLAGRYEIMSDFVDSVKCLVHPLNFEMLSYSNPRTALEGKFSMEFCLAIALLEKQVGLEQFSDEKVLEPETQDLIKRIHMDVNPAMKGKDYKPGSVVEIKLKDGKQYRHEVHTPEGSPRNRLTWKKLKNKYENCCRLAISENVIAESENLITNLTTIQEIGQLADLIR